VSLKEVRGVGFEFGTVELCRVRRELDRAAAYGNLTTRCSVDKLLGGGGTLILRHCWQVENSREMRGAALRSNGSIGTIADKLRITIAIVIARPPRKSISNH
jgi:hypothetical protein